MYLQAMGAAAGVSALFVLALGRAWPPAGTTRRNVACVLGIALGLALGCRVLQLRTAWPPVNGLDRLLTIVFPAVIAIELMAGLQRVPRWCAWLLRMSLAAASGRILLHGSVYLAGPRREWTEWQAGVALALCGSLLAAVWVLLTWLSQRSSGGASIPLVLSQATLCGGILVMLAGYVTGGEASLPLAAALAGSAVASSLLADRSDAQGMIGIGIVVLFGLLFIGRFFGGLSTDRALAVFLAPLLCWATEMPMLRRRSPWLVGVIRLALVAIPLVVVLALAKRDFDRDTAPLLGARINLQGVVAFPGCRG